MPFPSLFDSIIALTGPTASGKTDLAVAVAQALAERAGGRVVVEILSLDSIAVYRHMDIGTAKPTADQRAAVPHHLIDLVSPDREFSVAEYLELAHAKVARILARGRWPMFVGGTPMFLKAILRGFDPGPPADEMFRRQVAEDVERFGVEALRARLRQVDPLSAVRIDGGDVRRMTRALEFARLTGTPISHHQTQFEVTRPASRGRVWALQTPREVLHRRIADRVDGMFAAGLVDEVRGLLERPGGLSKTARQAVGYRELIAAIESGDDPASAADLVLFHTRRLARRQETWIRSFSEIRPLPTHDGDVAFSVQHLVRLLTPLCDRDPP